MNAPSKATNYSVTKLLKRYGTLIGFLVIVAVFWWQKPDTFMTIPNWVNITRQVSILGVVAFTMTVVMVTGDFDLSVGAMASLVSIVAGTLFQQEVDILQAVSMAILVGAIGGLFNGILVSYVGISAFVATLGTLTVFRGLALYISNGSSIFGQAIPDAFSEFGRAGIEFGEISGQRVFLPNLTILAFIVLVVIFILLGQTVIGRRLHAVGGNLEAARLGGLPVNALRLFTFIISGIGAAIAGLMLFSRLATANPTQGEGLMLQAIASVFLGMTMTEENQPHVLGTLIGVLILGVLANGLTQLQIDTYVQQILTGVIIILAVTLSSLSQKDLRLGSRFRTFLRFRQISGGKRHD